MWKSMIRPSMIFLAFACGVLFQLAAEPHWKLESGVDLSTLLIRCALIVMMYLICLRLKLSELKVRMAHLKILAANLLMGIVPYLILHFCGREDLALAAFFTGITPTANAAPVVMNFLHGRVGFVATGFVTTNLGIGLAMTGLLPLVTGEHSVEYLRNLAFQLAALILLPAAAAAVTRLLASRAPEWADKMKNFSYALWCFTLFIIAARTAEFFRNRPGFSLFSLLEILAVSLILCVMNFTLGYFLAERRFSREASQTLGQKNTSFTMYLALAFGGPSGTLAALGPTFYILWHNLWNALQMYFYDRRRNRIRK